VCWTNCFCCWFLPHCLAFCSDYSSQIEFCRDCRQGAHTNSCEEAKLASSSSSFSSTSSETGDQYAFSFALFVSLLPLDFFAAVSRASESWILDSTKPCPACRVRIFKDQGCNHMSCSRYSLPPFRSFPLLIDRAFSLSDASISFVGFV
jgi:hypothetical protein